ncbi:MAG TPA: phycocyanin alpha phycocyanobilin lyase [Chloroflexi bacterium]|nr:phycocyanin alpha phycocyanobilin lyase [Chloroflexota bacterium]HBY45334.1 phycocyanin alpha phycocyanobilin lyase [Chloroflexota bacterium]
MHSSTPPPPDRSDSDGTVDGVEAFLDAIVAAPDERPPTSPLSDLDRPATTLLRDRWDEIPMTTRIRIVRDMAQDAEDHVERHYQRALLVACRDSDPDVRLAAFDGLWEFDSPELLRILLSEIAEEPDARVREAMATGLGRFAADSDDDLALNEVLEALFERWEGDSAIDVRRRALESLGFLSGDDIVEAIEDAYNNHSIEIRASALQAMGRQGDNRWLDACLRELRSDDPELRFEAVTALGSIGDQRTVSAIVDMTDDEDVEVALAAIAALGEVGGPMAVNRLRQLSEDQSRAVAEAAADALQEASIMANPLRPLM